MNTQHRFQSICPYFAMFPGEFVRKHLTTVKERGVVFDPFCGRGTTVFESLLQGRLAIGTDVNPVAVCISRAKAMPPSLDEVHGRIRQLEENYDNRHRGLGHNAPAEFFKMCFCEQTLRQVLFLREKLKWQTSRTDCFIAALALGALHGESHRSPNYLSNRMPRTISTKPDYSVAWWRSRELAPPNRDAFEILRRMAGYRYADPLPSLNGDVVLADARTAGKAFHRYRGMVNLVITSPPYLDITDYQEDQWLRLWFLGGTPRPVTRNNKDDRHRNDLEYWTFLREVWAGMEQLLAPKATIVVRIGGRNAVRESIRDSLLDSLTDGLPHGRIRLLDDGLTTKISGGQLQSFNPKSKGIRVEHDFRFLFERRPSRQTRRSPSRHRASRRRTHA